MRAEWSAIIRNKKLLIPIIAILFMPIIYAGMFIWAFWDPYGQVENLPVAVVNLDRPVSYNNERISIGDEIVSKLKSDQKLKWSFVSKEEGLEGIKTNKYYAVIEIPKNFSKNATSIIAPSPQHAQLRYIPNQGYNFVSTKITDTVAENLRKTISENLTEKFTEVMFEKFSEVGAGFAKGAEGTKNLSEGMDQLYIGTSSLINTMQEKSTSLSELVRGTSLIQEKTSELSDGLQQLNTGMADIRNGSERLTKNTATMRDSLQTFGDNLNQFNSGQQKLKGGTKEVADGANALSVKHSEAVAAQGQLTQGMADLESAMRSYAAKKPELQEDPEFQALLRTAENLSTSSRSLQSGEQEIQTNLERLSSSLETIKNSQVKLTDSSEKLFAAQKDIKEGFSQFSNGQQNLNQGIGKAAEGMINASAGSEAINVGAAKLTEGMTAVETGWKEIITSLNSLSAGEQKILSGLDSLESGLREGEKQVSNIQTNNSVRNRLFASPVTIERSNVSDDSTYGIGSAPYFLSLGLFIGPLMLSIIFPMKEPVRAPRSGFQWFTSKLTVLLPVSLLQSIIAATIILFGLDVEVTSVPLFYLFTLITSLTFMFIIQFLVTTFGNPGRFVAVIILILQLTTSGGTYPVELIAPELQPFQRLLPMYYSVTGLREIIGIGDYSIVWQQSLILAVFAAVSVLLSIVAFRYFYNREFKEVS
ncbi:YhgE/Pip domain-containing protein [Bacillus sp. AFS040349]|uniref:YhgE/Pip domain-containing protein n=1 Tax=Bacillus sp. AFS040349 TaxID=2033502 RepID=UPI000BFE3CAA|nr:YhgE/Pip domain-containing protein [Bacillus sp. AFS040349]PGT85053.1 hypothetical protein COD11_09415 [Bacillus sp. AFS040349]